MPNLSLFAVTAPGLESFTARELRQLGLLSGAPAHEPGGVAFAGDLRELYRANLYLRTAGRVLVRLGEFYAAAFSELRKKASRLPWENFLAPGQPATLRVTCHKSKLYHSDAVAERIAGAIEDRLGKSVSRAKPSVEDDEVPTAQLIVVRLLHDKCTLSLDSSGALLHRRGYRQAIAKAPLRETLAAAMLLASGWDMAAPLLDPFCGSGTIAIEAALLARNIAPGSLGRRFAFMDWPNFDRALWKALCARAPETAAATLPAILASDRDAGAMTAARENAARAGVADCINFSRRAVSAIEPPPAPGWIVTNPPYGVRVSENQDLRNLYAQFGHVVRSKCPGWEVTMLSYAPALQHQTGLSFDPGLALIHGGLKIRLVRAKG